MDGLTGRRTHPLLEIFFRDRKNLTRPVAETLWFTFKRITIENVSETGEHWDIDGADNVAEDARTTFAVVLQLTRGTD